MFFGVFFVYFVSFIYFCFVDDWWCIVFVLFFFWMQVVGLFVFVILEVYFGYIGDDYDFYFVWWFSVGFLLVGFVGCFFQQGILVWCEWFWIGGVIFVVIVLVFLLVLKVNVVLGNKFLVIEQEIFDIVVLYIMKKEGICFMVYCDIVGVWIICGGIIVVVGICVYLGMMMSMD